MVKVVICGGSGYAGSELLRILALHPGVEVTAVTSEQSAGKYVTDLFPHLFRYKGLRYGHLERQVLLDKGDVFFTALPHSASQETVDYFYKNGKKVIDFSADYRLKDPEDYRQWYGVQHRYQDTLKDAVYGLPEIYREKIRGASVIANPGCYPTSIILALYPAIAHGIVVPETIVADSKSGVSGAGRKSEVGYSFCEVNQGFRAYGIGNHRHTPEIEQELSAIARQSLPNSLPKSLKITFTPHLLPINRGILSTVYADLGTQYADMPGDTKLDDIVALYKETFRKEPFVDVMEKGGYPDVKNVRGTNYCQIGIGIGRTGKLIAVAAIDNLVKGAAGQAVQNMNILYGFDETTALDSLAVNP
ncbi:MAG: N-acetyl-gamma-glutamyl-phosphate reductase [Nitrospirae bacterium]|nr:N-acetyl-gamma-glutamyl-phosphate reductase [Nitrospirota bacterium]